MSWDSSIHLVFGHVRIYIHIRLLKSWNSASVHLSSMSDMGSGQSHGGKCTTYPTFHEQRPRAQADQWAQKRRRSYYRHAGQNVGIRSSVTKSTSILRMGSFSEKDGRRGTRREPLLTRKVVGLKPRLLSGASRLSAGPSSMRDVSIQNQSLEGHIIMWLYLRPRLARFG